MSFRTLTHRIKTVSAWITVVVHQKGATKLNAASC
jgi:hypothetical protein